ncbi:MAG: hypothetical protein EBR86_10770 [Planctomycetia bacterium]|nr:hypothetical protein [Planctomycetia bacterium]
MMDTWPRRSICSRQWSPRIPFDLAYSALAAWCTRLDRHAEAVGYARKVCELKPLDPFSFTALSVACVRAGMIPEAEEAMARSRALQG